MFVDKWTLIRVQNKNHLAKQWEEDKSREVLLTDLNVVMIPRERHLLLQEKEKRLIEIEEALDKSPELVRDFKIARAKIDYERSVAR